MIPGQSLSVWQGWFLLLNLIFGNSKAVSPAKPIMLAKSYNSWSIAAILGGRGLKTKKEVINKLQKNYPYLGQNCAKRFINYYGTLSYQILKNVKSKKDLGKNFGHSLTEIEVDWLLKNEFAKSVDDILWRRTKLGLKFNDSEKNKLENWLKYKI